MRHEPTGHKTLSPDVITHTSNHRHLILVSRCSSCSLPASSTERRVDRSRSQSASACVHIHGGKFVRACMQRVGLSLFRACSSNRISYRVGPGAICRASSGAWPPLLVHGSLSESNNAVSLRRLSSPPTRQSRCAAHRGCNHSAMPFAGRESAAGQQRQ